MRLITLQGVFTRIDGQKILLRSGVLHDFDPEESAALLAMVPPGARVPKDESAQPLAAEIVEVPGRKTRKRRTDEV